MHDSKRKKGKKFFTLLIIACITFFGFYKYYNSTTHNPVDKNDDMNISFQIKKGATIQEISEDLKEKNLIKSAFTFRLYTRFNKLDKGILAGRFLLNKTMDVPTILKNISDPSQAEFIITIQEGLTIKDIEKKLLELGLIEQGDFISAVKNFDGWKYYNFLESEKLKNLDLPIEGYLYPDTYFLDPANFEAKDLIYLALDNFEKKWNDLEKDNSKLEQYNFNEIITMASIIENEVFGKEDRLLVSGILWKRHENGWPLGADATLLYITDDRSITAEDLNIDSAYNTRKNQGLPPGPISNPSIESIEAALYPKDSEYWFYLTTLDTGKVIYAKTNEEHNANRSKYL